MNQSNSSKQVLLSVIGVAILVVAVVGVSFAFFNYTRTGAANTVETGKIKFNSTQSGQIQLTNVFPLTSDQLAEEIAKTTEGNAAYDANYKANFAEIQVTISGETTYSAGLDYQVTASGVDFTANGAAGTALPVKVETTFVEATGTNAGVIGDSNTTLDFGEHKATGDAYRLYSYGSDNTAMANGNPLLVGHIGPTTGETAFSGHRYSGVLTIRAYIDASRVAITDTLVGETYDGGTNGTTGPAAGTWVNGRVRYTTEQWNAIQGHPLTFSVKVESRETGGTFVS